MFARLASTACMSAAVCALGAAALMSPVGALASHGHSGAKAHRAKSKRKAKGHKGSSVTVKCASVTVTCKGTPGPAGPQGPAGPAGAPGAAGINGANVVLRAREVGAVSAELTEARKKECEAEKPELPICGARVPLSQTSWTEGAGEDDQFIGSVTASIPSQAACKRENSKKELESDELVVFVEVDNKLEALSEVSGEKSAKTLDVPIDFDFAVLIALEGGGSPGVGTGFFLGNGTPQPHTLQVQAVDDCPDEAGVTHASISNLAIDVLGTM
jgi:hypothetical protein